MATPLEDLMKRKAAGFAPAPTPAFQPPAVGTSPMVRPTGTGPMAPTGQLVVQPRPSPSPGMKNVTGTATTVRPAELPGAAPRPSGPGLGSRVASGLVKGAVIGAATTPNVADAPTISGAIRARLEAGESTESIEADFGAGSVGSSAFYGSFDPLPEEGPQMSKLGDEPISFTAPSGPSSTPAVNAELPDVQAPTAGLMGDASVPSPAVPTSTFDVNTRASDAPEGTVTVPTGLADQTIQDSLTPNQPLRNVNELMSSGRAAYGEQNVADFMANRDTPESATEQFLDPQGRLRRRDKATQELTSDYTSYEKEAAAREQRMGQQSDFGTAVSDRDRRAARGEGMSDADRGDIAKANASGASAGDIARGDKVAELNGVDRKTGKPLESEKTAYETRLEGLDVAQREANLTKTNAQINDIISKKNPDAKDTTWSASQIGSLQDVMTENNLEMDEGKLWDKTGWGRTEIKQGDPEYDMIAGTDVGRAMLGLDAGGAPAVGATKGGYTFKGGDPADKNNWVKV